MFEIIYKRSFGIDSCLIEKQLIQEIHKIAGQSKTVYTLRSDTKDIRSDDVELFLGLEWPRYILDIRVEISGPLGNVVIDLNCGRGRRSRGNVWVTGSDVTWVEGVSSQLEGVFRSAGTWYWCIVKYWQIRALLSALLVALLMWRLDYSMWSVASQHLSLSEIQFFLLMFAVGFALSVYPLERIWLWIFPFYEFEQTNKQRIRRYLGAILGLILTWVVTNIILPSLVP
jgi:hypothetical protein